jgi:cytochrome c oxidase assembly protein subunit 15
MVKLAWFSLAFNLLVIVWGAYVRASNSGAGCGSHWPLCNGDFLPKAITSAGGPSAAGLATAIEFAHRATSGICLILAVAIAWMGVKHYPKGNAVRRAAWAVLGFTLSEAIVGAGLVLFGWVNRDESMGRAISITVHLINTFSLLGALALTAWWSLFRNDEAPSESPPSPLASRSEKVRGLSMISLVTVTLLGMTGAIAALGDTLFRSTSLSHGFTQDFSSQSHFLLRLRLIHPVLALGAAGLLFYLAELASAIRQNSRRVTGLATLLKSLVAIQLGIGITNLALLAPTSLQLVHLFTAELLWIALVLLAAEVLRAPLTKPTGTAIHSL